MPHDVPDDIWLEVIESLLGIPGFDGNKAVQGLSLSCQRLRELASPFLYRSLQFSLPRTGSEDDVEAALIRAHIRANSLRDFPYLLQHVQNVSLIHWDGTGLGDMDPDYLRSYDNFEGVNSRGLLGAFPVVTYLVAGLISHMPALQQLELWCSPMTCALYDAVCSRPLLTSLRVLTSGETDMLHIPIELSCLPYIRHLHYIAGYSCSTERYLTHILEHCILDLKSLGIHSAHLSLLIAHISNRTLSITTLHVTFPCHSTDVASSLAMLDVLCASPDLRSLRIHGNPQDIRSPNLDPQFLPGLVDIHGTAGYVRALTPGKHFKSIHISQTFCLGDHSIMNVLRCSTTALLNLTIRVRATTSDDLFVCLQSLRVFANLEYIRIAYQLQNMDWLTRRNLQEMQHAVGSVLRSFSNLHTCHIYNEDSELHGGDVGCPVGTAYNPSDRGHASLEWLRVEFLSTHLWRWVPQRGWMHSLYISTDWI